MERIQLSPRLEAVASFIRPGDRVADVGTDHGYLPVWLRQNGLSPLVIASDIHELPLETAKDSARRYGVSGIQFRLCDGLRGLEQQEADCVTIAGMSGETIQAILSGAGWDWTGKRLVLQPMTKRHELLAWLYQSGFHLAGERFAQEKAGIYRVFCVEPGYAPPPRPAHLWGGFTDTPYARRQAARLKKAIQGLSRAASPDLALLRVYQAVLEDMRDAFG